MISTVLSVGFQRLLHNRVELLLTFVVPICFFSIFAVIFGRGMGTTPKVKTVLVSESDQPITATVLQELRDSPGLRVMQSQNESLSRQEAEWRVRSGTVTMAIILSDREGQVHAELLADTSDQVAPPIVSALVTRSILKHAGAPQTGDFEQFAQNLASPDPTRTHDSETATGSVVNEVASKPETVIREPQVVVTDVLREGKSNPIVSMYAAGIAVMFLLFGATNGGGALLEERENQTLERLLATRLTMSQLLFGKWIYQSAVGTIQVVIMFVWAQLVFGVDLVGHVVGFAAMAIVTAVAAAAFGLFLATLCKSRSQLSGLSVIVILTMSALGGSMVPRYVMSEGMREAGLWTFNAWALDGFDKIFWRDLPISTLGPQLMVLVASAVVFFVVARVLALRWETE